MPILWDSSPTAHGRYAAKKHARADLRACSKRWRKRNAGCFSLPVPSHTPNECGKAPACIERFNFKLRPSGEAHNHRNHRYPLLTVGRIRLACRVLLTTVRCKEHADTDQSGFPISSDACGATRIWAPGLAKPIDIRSPESGRVAPSARATGWAPSGLSIHSMNSSIPGKAPRTGLDPTGSGLTPDPELPRGSVAYPQAQSWQRACHLLLHCRPLVTALRLVRLERRRRSDAARYTNFCMSPRRGRRRGAGATWWARRACTARESSTVAMELTLCPDRSMKARHASW
jgi:hypothetical protein